MLRPNPASRARARLFVGDYLDDCELELHPEQPIRVPVAEVPRARSRRGALLAAAKLVYDTVLFDLVHATLGTPAADLDEERFVVR